MAWDFGVLDNQPLYQDAPSLLWTPNIGGHNFDQAGGFLLPSIRFPASLDWVKTISINVVNKKWRILVRSDKGHEKLFPNTHGIAIQEERKIHIRKSSLNLVTLIHELIHAYQFELSFYELELDDDQVEEWFAELFAKYGDDILRDAKIVLMESGG